jgi:hypothetical protein
MEALKRIMVCLSPRVAVRKVLNVKAKSFPYVLLALVSLLYFISGAIFIKLSIGMPPSITTKVQLLQQLFWMYILVTSLYLVFTQFFSLFVWWITRSLDGKADLPKTRLAILFTMLCFAPFCYFFLLIPVNSPVHNALYYIRAWIGIIGGVATFLYALLAAGKTLAEVNSFSSWKAWLSLIIGGGLFCCDCVYDCAYR